jgi:hypothetical protein
VRGRGAPPPLTLPPAAEAAAAAAAAAALAALAALEELLLREIEALTVAELEA